MGVEISARMGWIIMESIPVLFLTLILIIGNNKDFVVLFFWAIWTTHYVNRAWAWPNRAKLDQKLIPLSVVIFAIIFNTINCWLNGIWLFDPKSRIRVILVYGPRFLLGVSVFFLRMIINIKSDNILFFITR